MASLTPVLRTGDVVLLRCNLHDGSSSIAVDSSDANGFVSTNGLTGNVCLLAQEDAKEVDIRDMMFLVVVQLSYTAQKDLKRRRKHMALQANKLDPLTASAQMYPYERRSQLEERQNAERLRSTPRAVSYGEIIQLMHIRTQRFLNVRGKMPASLQRTSRRVELAVGSATSWLRVNPYFKHRVQGAPVALEEQVTLESEKLTNNWNLNWAKCMNMAQEPVLEVNCAREGRGFYFVLYNRPVHGSNALGIPAPVILHHPHHAGNITASSDPAKVQPFLRRSGTDQDDTATHCAKDVWVLEPADSTVSHNGGIEWGHTQVLLRHLGSGRYLTVSESSLREEFGRSTHRRESVPAPPQSPAGRRDSASRRERMSLLNEDSSRLVSLILTPFPGNHGTFVLENSSSTAAAGADAGKEFVARTGACGVLRWTNPPHGQYPPLWLSCRGLPKGQRRSLFLHASEKKHARDAIQIHYLGPGDPFMLECDVVAEHTTFLRKSLVPRCRDFADPCVALMMCAQCEHALSDMIYFLSGSPNWRAATPTPTVDGHGDALRERWTVKPGRQQLVKEMKYVDASFELFHELVKQTTSLVDGDVRWGRRAAALNLSLHVPPGALSVHQAPRAWGQAVSDLVAGMKTRCLKLLVRLWLYCFLDSPSISQYFCRHGWLNVVDSLNGHGLGASEVFVALLRGAPELVRNVEKSTLVKFIRFIRVLGPLDTWLSFLKAICGNAERVNSTKQQQVLRGLVFSGYRAAKEEQQAAAANRRELLISLRLGSPLGTALGPPPKGAAPPPLEQCMAREILVDGLCDIIISWAHPQQWIVGQGALFHGPEALGLRHRSGPDRAGRIWVSLVQVVWILQPERCCEASTGERWEERQKRDGGELHNREEEGGAADTATTTSPTSLDSLATLAKYFLAQLRLVSSLVRERQMNCIMALQEEYSLSVCLCGASDPRLPTSVRAAFFDLLSDLWIDRHPHTQVVVPVLMRHFEVTAEVIDDFPAFQLHQVEQPDSWSQSHLESLPAEVLLFFSLGQPHKCEAVLRAVRRFLSAGFLVEQQVHSAADDNVLMCAVLRLLGLLLRFGFIHTVPMINELLGPLLRCLDGRTDWVTAAPAEDRVDTASMAVRPASLQGGPLGDVEVGEAEGGTQEVIAPLLPSPPPPTLSTHTTHLPMSRFPPDSSGLRFMDCEENRGIFAVKAELLATAMHAVNLKVHAQISRVMQTFYLQVWNGEEASGITSEDARNQHVHVTLPPGVVNKVMQALDHPVVHLSHPYIRSLESMCLDLVMYDHPVIFSRALELLFSVCCQTESLFEKLDKVEILTPTQDKLFCALKVDVTMLGKLIYNFEIWGADDEFSAADSHQVKMVERICSKLQKLCTHGDEVSTRHEVQKMLHETEFLSLLTYTLKVDAGEFSPSCGQLLSRITGLMCRTACTFVAGHPKNQNLVFRELPIYEIKVLQEQPDYALLLAEVFRGNFELCEQVPMNLLTIFGNLVVAERQKGSFAPWYLSFFTAIVAAGAQALPRNQHMVVDLLQSLPPSLTVHLLQSEDERTFYLAANFERLGQLRSLDVAKWKPGGDAELLYYVSSLELLVGIARGHGTETIMNKPFVNSLFPAVSAIRLLLRSSHVVRPAPETDNPQPSRSVLLRMRVLWLQIVQLLLYDVEVGLLDMDVLSSPVHAEFFAAMLTWVQEVLQPVVGGEATGMKLQKLGAEDEEYFKAVLLCIDVFFASSHLGAGGLERCRLEDIGHQYQQYFSRVLEHNVSAYTNLRDAAAVRTTALRVARTSTGEQQQSLPSWRSRRVAVHAHKATSAAEARFHGMMRSLAADERIKERVQHEAAHIGSVVCRVSEMTDPESPDYLQVMPRELSEGLPDGADFRRCLVTTEEVLKRFVRHCQGHLRTDLSTLRRVQKLLNVMLQSTKEADDVVALENMQLLFVRTGVTKLVIQMLDAKVSDEITSTSWTLLAELLHTNNPAQLVNRAVQQALLDVCINDDDSGVWESLGDILRAVSSKVKSVHKLKLLPSFTEEEMEEIHEFDVCLAYAVRAMNAVCLMVEGHFVRMQEYLHSQIGNSRSCNVPQVAAQLLISLGKDPAAADLADANELDCLRQVCSLLTELAQGPNLRNQEFLSSFGIVETLFKLLAANYERFRKATGEVYPLDIRRLKALYVQTLLSLLEGRLDKIIHYAMLQRVDAHVVRTRLQFVHMHFVFGITTTARGSATPAGVIAMDMQSRAAALMAASAEPSDVNKALVPAMLQAEELLEDLNDQELDELFSEGFSLLELVFTLAPYSTEFGKEVIPEARGEAFNDKTAAYATERDLERERVAFHMRDNYRHAFFFLKRFVKTIEVVLNGHLHTLHFQFPLTAMWYVHGAAKQKIIESIPFSSSDTKAKAFVQMCAELHSESKLIRDLSQFSLVPSRYQHVARRHLPDGAHRPFQVFLANDAQWMQRLLLAAVILGVMLAAHTGMFLLWDQTDDSQAEDADNELPWREGRTHWRTPLAEQAAYGLGALQFACTLLWVTLTVSIKLPLNVNVCRKPGKRIALVWAGALCMTLADGVLVWRLFLLLCCGSALFFRVFWLFSLLLMDCVLQSSQLVTVLHAITGPGAQLLMTFLGASIVTFVYAAIGFRYFQSDYAEHCHPNILTCTQNILYQGTRSGIVGLSNLMRKSDPHTADFPERMSYDMSYFVVFGIMLLNTVVALIVDSFIATRMERLAREQNLETESFISCIDRKSIEAASQLRGISDGFAHHETQLQNKWDYMAFVFHLREKNVQDYTGPEQTIRSLIGNEDVSWMPLGRSKLLEDSESVARREDVLVRLEKQSRKLARRTEASMRIWKGLCANVSGLDTAMQQRLDSILEELRTLKGGVTAAS